MKIKNRNLSLLHCYVAAALCGINDGAVAVPSAVADTKATSAALEASNAATLQNQIDTSKIPHPEVQTRPYAFHFKETKAEMVKDDKGADTAVVLKEAFKRPTVKLALPVPTLDGLINGLQDVKVQEYVLELLADQAYMQARVQINDETKPVNKQEDLDISKLTLQFLAHMPKAERTGGGISKDVWEAMAKDYEEVMPAVTGKTAERINAAAKLLLAKFQPIKTNKPAISFLKEQLALWFTNTTKAEDYKECFEFLDEKADTLLKADETALLANL